MSLLEHITNLSTKLIAIQSVAEDIAAQKQCLDILADTFADTFTAHHYTLAGHPALVLTTAAGTTSDIIISGHIDVVHAPEAAFESHQEGDYFYGRGAYDMKAPLVAALYGAQEALKLPGAPTVAVLITADEEVSGNGTKALIEDEGYRASCALIPDGGSPEKIIIGQKGFLQCKITVPGVGGHASRPWQVANPIDTVMKMIGVANHHFPHPDDFAWQTTITPTKIEGGLSLNQIPNEAIVYFDIRFTDRADIDRFVTAVQAVADTTIAYEVVAENELFSVAADDSNVLRLQSIMEKTFGFLPELGGECGTSDAVFLGAADIPTALFRPVGGSEHTDTEWVSLSSLEKTAVVTTEFITSHTKNQS